MIYPKFKSKEECAYPERIDCNGDAGDCKLRCPYMKYDNSKSIFDSTRWKCTYKVDAHNKEYVQENKESTHKQDIEIN